MTIWQAQANLNKGELDPTLRGRIDTDIYYNALEKARNVLLTPQGGLKKRPGTKYLYQYSADADKIVDFSFNQDTNYILSFELGATTRMRIFKDGVIQTNINGSGNDYLDFASTNSLAGFYYIQSANTGLIFSMGDAPLVVARTSDTAWTVTSATFTNIPQYDFNDASSPTPVAEVQSLGFNSVNDSDTYRLSIDGFLSEDIAWSNDTTENENRLASAIQAMPNTANSGVSVVFNSGTTYDVTFGGESSGTYGLIQGVPVLTQSTTFSTTTTRTTPGTSRKEDAFSSTRGWPRTATFHQSRLWLGGTKDLPDSLFGSVVSDFFNYDLGKARDDEGIFVTLQTNQVNRIQAITSARKLQVFTTGSEFYCPEDVITPSNIRFDVSTNYGTKNINPVTLDGSVIYPQNEGRALVITEVVNQYQPISSRNIGVLAPHLLNDIQEVVLSRGNEDTDANYVYCLNADGDIACLNYLALEGVEGFSLWETNGSIISIAVSDKKLYMLVNRNGTVYLEIEDDTFTVDCGVEITGSQTVDTSHYTGTVEAIGDGAYLGEFTSSVSVDLGRVVTTGFIGVAYRPVAKVMPLVQGLNNGPNYARKKRIRRAILQLYESNGVVVNGSRIPDRTIGVNQFSAPIPQTGIVRIPLRGYALEQQIEVTQTTPMAFFVLSIGAEVKT